MRCTQWPRHEVGDVPRPTSLRRAGALLLLWHVLTQRRRQFDHTDQLTALLPFGRTSVSSTRRM